MLRSGWLGLVGLGSGGLVVGHALAYAVAFPAADHRHAVLLVTGHGYLPAAAWVVAVLGVTAAFATIVRASRGRAPVRSFAALAAVQAGGFVVLETGERVVAGLAPFELALPVAIGVAVQLVVAAAGALLTAGLHRIGAMLARQPLPVDRRRVGRIEAPAIVPDVGFDADPNPARAPPLLLVA